MWGLSKSERRRHGAEMLYKLESGFREESCHSEEFVYDAEHDLYRFPDGEFAFSQEYANEKRLREEGFIGWLAATRPSPRTKSGPDREMAKGKGVRSSLVILSSIKPGRGKSVAREVPLLPMPYL